VEITANPNNAIQDEGIGESEKGDSIIKSMGDIMIKEPVSIPADTTTGSISLNRHP
jgi:hypothetical protein